MISRIFLALILAFTTTLAGAGAASAYELAPSGKFHHEEIDDGRLYICYGTRTTDGIYVNRGTISNYLQPSWGAMATFNGTQLHFKSNGLCNNDGSNIEIKWDRSMDTCSPWLGRVQGNVFNWSQATIWLNAACNINGMFDWNPGNGTDSYSAIRTILHEVGHALGLGHSQDPQAIMTDSGYSCPKWGYYQGVRGDDYAGFTDEYDGYASHAPLTMFFPHTGWCQP